MISRTFRAVRCVRRAKYSAPTAESSAHRVGCASTSPVRGSACVIRPCRWPLSGAGTCCHVPAAHSASMVRSLLGTADRAWPTTSHESGVGKNSPGAEKLAHGRIAHAEICWIPAKNRGNANGTPVALWDRESNVRFTRREGQHMALRHSVLTVLGCAFAVALHAGTQRVAAARQESRAPLGIATARVTLAGTSNIHEYTASTTTVRVTRV